MYHRLNIDNKMRATLIIVLMTISRIMSQTCDETADSVELKDRFYNGIEFKEGEYFVDSKTGTVRGCICLKETCVQKCCHIDYGFDDDVKVNQCVELKEEFHPPVWEESETKQFTSTKKLLLSKSKKLNCSVGENIIKVSDSTRDYHLTPDGRLQIRIEKKSVLSTYFYGLNKYCMDNFLYENTTKVDAFVCFAEEKQPSHLKLNASCMLVSCFFMILTVAVYSFLEDLRNSVHGMIMIAYLLSVSVDFLFMATMQILLIMDNISPSFCTGLTFIIYFAMNAGFFWLNVMCFDIWQKFRKVNITTHGVSSDERTRFLRYSAYAFGVPSALTILVAALEFSGLKKHKLLPNIRRHGCFISGTSKMLYLYTPMLLICIVNVIFFGLVAIKIAQIKKQTQRLQKKDTQRYALYIKLFLLTGFSWILEAISSEYPAYDAAWQFTDAYNVLFGVLIFIMFVCKKKMFTQIMQKFRKMGRGKTLAKLTPGLPSSTQMKTSEETMTEKRESFSRV